jgi:hypothetical protein
MSVESKALKLGEMGTLFNKRVGAVFCRKYEGLFNTEPIQNKADTGLWFTRIMGNPFNQEGSGQTPAWAIKDSIERNNDLIKKLTQANQALNSALSEFEQAEGTT